MKTVTNLEYLTINGERCKAYNSEWTSTIAKQCPAEAAPVGHVIAGPAYSAQENAAWAARQNLTLAEGEQVMFDGALHTVEFRRGQGYTCFQFNPVAVAVPAARSVRRNARGNVVGYVGRHRETTFDTGAEAGLWLAETHGAEAAADMVAKVGKW